MEPLKRLATEYFARSFDVISVEHFFKTAASNQESYQTIRGAFIFPLKGRAQIFFNQQDYLVQPGILLHGCPEQSIRFVVEDDIVFEYITIYYFSKQTNLILTHPLNLDLISPILQELTTFNWSDAKSQSYQKEILLLKLFDQVFTSDHYQTLTNEKDLIQQTCQYIEEHYHQKLSLAQLAQYAGKNKTQLSYLFHKYQGIRPIDYLIDLRIKHAIQMMRAENLTVREVAERVGYHDPLYFSRLFKKKTGYTPMQVKQLFHLS